MHTRLTALSLIVFSALVCLGAEIPRPRPGTFVHDFAAVVPDDREAEIQARAERLRDEYKTEVAVVTVETLGGEESFDYSMRMAREWGIGSKDDEVRGLLILVAVKDRKTAFRTSRHVEGELPDGVTGEISREMNAYFRNGDFGGGLSAGMDRILGRMKEVYRPAAATAPAPAPGSRLRWLWLPAVGLPALGLGYAALRRRARKRSEAAQQSGDGSGFRQWAETKDPSTKPRPKTKSHEITRAGSRAAAGDKKKNNNTASRGGGHTAVYGYESTSYGSSSSHESSSSSSYDSGSSSSSSDSGSSYSGGSDFGGGGSDSGW